MAQTWSQRAPFNDWWYWSECLVKRLRTMADLYRENGDIERSGVANDWAKKLKDNCMKPVAAARKGMKTDEEKAELKKLEEEAIFECAEMFRDMLVNLPFMSSAIQDFLYINWEDVKWEDENAGEEVDEHTGLPLKKKKKKTGDGRITELFWGPKARQDEGLRSGKVEDGGLPGIIYNLMLAEKTTSSRSPTEYGQAMLAAASQQNLATTMNQMEKLGVQVNFKPGGGSRPMLNNAPEEITIHDEAAFAAMRRAGKLAAEVLDYITPYVVPGARTGDLDDMCNEYTLKHGATSAPLGYRGYPRATCISPNHIVCHGIPGDKRLEEGDITNIDVTVILDGWYGDTSRMFFVGDKIGIKGRKLVDITYECMMLGIGAVKPGNHLGDIGFAIQSHAEAVGFSVVRDFCGHGVGRIFHTAPSVLHYGEAGTGDILKPGMIFTVEPMINAGRPETKVLKDGWTAVTKDKSLSAQFEHTIGVTETGCEIFTSSPKGWLQPPYT